ncbi:hypothetical protein [Botrimarina colliarenosi]|nr:hypothetical protein [Botrimarina colliarenosi]
MPDSPHPPQPTSVPQERTVAVVWPSIAAGAWGQWLGRLYGNRLGVRIAGVPLLLGWLIAIVTAPLAALLYLARKAPRKPLVLFGPVNADGLRYRLTTKRLLIENPFEKDASPVAQLAIDDFDAVEIDVLPGQAWYHAGDVVFLKEGKERLRLAGTPRPEPFVHTVLNTQQACRLRRPETKAKAGDGKPQPNVAV